MRQLVLVVFVVTLPNCANANDAGQGYGLGMRSCAEFAKSYAANPTVTEDLYFTWAQGFMSALNLSFTSSAGGYRSIDSNGMASYKIRIRSYCDAHPLTQYAQAVMDLYGTLPPRTAPSN